jgi:PDZ domain-containing secreted protein
LQRLKKKYTMLVQIIFFLILAVLVWFAFNLKIRGTEKEEKFTVKIQFQKEDEDED